MSNPEEIFSHTSEQKEIIQNFLKQGRRDVPTYLEGGAEAKYVEIDDGELRYFHHKPDNIQTKRPVVFIPGYVAAPISWVDFSLPLHGIGEYYYLETREKKSSKIQNKRKASMTVDQTAKDIGVALENLGMKNKDFVLLGSSYGSTNILAGLSKKYFTAPTIVVHDPMVTWVNKNRAMEILMQVVPKFILVPIKMPLAYIATMGMENKANRKRMLDFMRGVEPWKFKRCTLQNNKLDMFNDLKEIEEEVFFSTGPLDRYHFRSEFYGYAKEIAKGRFIFMNTPDEDRQLITGIIGREFMKVTQNEGIPESLKQFEIRIDR